MLATLKSSINILARIAAKNSENMDIKQIKPQEIYEIRDFLDQLEEYGHIYRFPPEKLDEPFKKILEGISEIQQLQKDSWSM